MDADGNNPAPAAQPVNLKIKNVKIPDFHGIPSKDSTTAQSLIQRINNLHAANNWDTSVAYYQFAIALKSKAQKWLEWQSFCADNTIETWEWIKPKFRKEFAMKSDDANILDKLAHLKMKHEEDVLDLHSQIFDIRRILRATKMQEAMFPTPNGQGLYTEEQVRTLLKKSDAIYEDHVQMQLLKHALPVDIKLAINLKNPTTSEEAHNIASMQYQTMQSKKQILEVM